MAPPAYLFLRDLAVHRLSVQLGHCLSENPFSLRHFNLNGDCHLNRQSSVFVVDIDSDDAVKRASLACTHAQCCLWCSFTSIRVVALATTASANLLAPASLKGAASIAA